MNWRIRIALRAINIRMSEGEVLEDILKSYPKLTDEEKAKIVEIINNRS